MPLGDIQTDRGNLHLDGSPHVIHRNDLGHIDVGAVHHIASKLSADIKSLHWRWPQVESDGKDRVDE